MDTNKILDLLEAAICSAGDGGDEPFTNEEYEAMFKYINEQRALNNK